MRLQARRDAASRKEGVEEGGVDERRKRRKE
jgi:hypothetical protein